MNIQKFTLPSEVFKLDTYLDLLRDPDKYGKLHGDLVAIVEDINDRLEALAIGKDANKALAKAQEESAEAHKLLGSMRLAREEWDAEKAGELKAIADAQAKIEEEARELVKAQQDHEALAADHYAALDRRNAELVQRDEDVRKRNNEAYMVKNEYDSKLARLLEKIKSEVK